MIPVAKIQELGALKDDCILGPIEPLYEPISMQPLGFSMPYMDHTEFLCKIFTKNFRDEKGINYQDITEMITGMQKTLDKIHKKGFLVVDYNEMNFLIGKDLKTVYYIDVDSYKTPSFPAMALMESVRDRKCPKGTFTELTDWFSFAVVTFQMYVGIHPYKGFYPKFAPAEWSKRMDLGISVFDKDVTLPKSCQDFSVIPQRHLEWYKSIFVKNERSVPPYADAIIMAITSGKNVSSGGKFIVELIKEFTSNIQKIYFFNGKRYVITNSDIYCEDRIELSFTKSGKGSIAMVDVFGENPIVCYLKAETLSFNDLTKNQISSLTATSAFSANGLVYSINNGDLLESSFDRLGKLIHQVKVVSSISPSHKVFPGIVVQDDFMKCHLAIPYAKGLCANVHVKELDGFRIIDARHEGNISGFIAEKSGNLWRYILIFDKGFYKYEVWAEQLNGVCEINFSVLPNGLNILADDGKIILFKDKANKKEFNNAPVDTSTRFYHNGMDVYFVDENKLYKIKML
jgi:serine/threonine protein kinase